MLEAVLSSGLHETHSLTFGITVISEQADTPMANRNTPRLLCAIWLGLLLSSGGCVLNEFVVVEGLGFAGVDAPCAQPVDPYYVPPCANVYAMDPAFFGYHPTCWTPWPEGWTGCPPCVTTVGMPMEAPGEDAAFSRTVAKPPSVLDELAPPIPDSTDWDIVPTPNVAPPKAKGEMGMPPETQEPRRLEAKAIEQSSPFREEEPPKEKAMEVPAETGPGEDAALDVPVPLGVPAPAPAKVPAPVPADVPAPVPAKAPAPVPPKAPAPVPADVPAPAPQGDESAQGALPERSPAIHTSAETNVGGIDSRVAVPSEAMLPAPLPEDVLTASAIKQEADSAKQSPESANERTATGLPIAPLPPFTAEEAAAEPSAGWAFCSDEGRANGSY